MSESSLYPTALDSTNIYEVVARLSTTLTADITAATTTIPLASTTGFPTKGNIVIDNETIAYISVSVGSVDATGGRGKAGTAASHLSTTQVLYAVTATDFNKLRAGLIAVQTKVGIDNSTVKTSLDYTTKTGWIEVTAGTYASASTITVASGAASIYQKGDKLRFVQGGGWKYFYIITVADTLLTVTGGTDFTVATPDAITSMAYSHIENPLGFQNIFNFTTTPSTGGSAYTNLPTINSAFFWVNSNVLTYFIKWTYHATSGGTVSSKFSIPIAATVNPGFGLNSATGVGLAIGAVGSYIYVYKYDGTTPIVNAQQCSATVSITF